MAKFFRFIGLPGLIIGSFLLSAWMTNTYRAVGLTGLIFGLFLLWIWLDSYSKQKLRESLFRNIGVPYRNLIGLLLGVTASLLPLTSGTWTISWAAWVFVGALGITMVLLVAVRPKIEKELDRFAWGLLVIIVFGFGLGALIYQTRSWWIYLWHQYLRINNTGAILLEALFLLGVILGFFVVRNWAKEQKDFVSSLSAVLSGAFLATILGKLQEGTALTPLRAFAYYALGFTMSGTINLMAAARLTANYVNKRSITSRAMLDFLYGSDRTKLIDGYFLQNFKDDPDYARTWLTDTLNEYRRLVEREFAERMEKRRKAREQFREGFKRKLDKDKDKSIKYMIEQRRKRDPDCSKRKAAEEKLEELQYEEDSIMALPEPRSPAQETQLEEIAKEIKDLRIERLRDKCSDDKMKTWEDLVQRLNQLRPSYFYELVAIEYEEESEPKDSTARVSNKDREYSVVYRYLGSNKAKAEDSHNAGGKQQDPTNPPFIVKEMFRAGVAARRQDLLEYISASGAYRASFPYFGSVSGLALMFKQTIIMDRDIYKKFRSKDHADGISPKEVEQSRGLDEIDFLSYITIPIVSRLGTASENLLGVVTIDTKVFVAPFKLEGHPVKASEGIFRTRLTPQQLTEYASNLYEPDDRDVDYIEEVTKIIVPVVELYNKCGVGAT
jgi:hypothetical protein